MVRFCQEILTGILVEVCGATTSEARLVAEDVSLRAESTARLDSDSREILAAPFYEESFDHEPDEAPEWMKAITTLVIRNSRLEDLHTNGPVRTGGITGVTRYGLGPLSHLIAARRLHPLQVDSIEDPFDNLTNAYPRAWACLDALRTVLNLGGGRISYRLPEAPVPELPDDSEVMNAPAAEHLETLSDGVTGVVFSAIDPRFDQQAYGWLKVAQEDTLTVGLSALSRISRNSRKQLRVLEFLLAHQARIITTNYLLTSKEVWVRRNKLVKPDSEHPFAGMHNLNGLSGSHRKTVESYIRQIS
jgi:hypothetical protein